MKCFLIARDVVRRPSTRGPGTDKVTSRALSRATSIFMSIRVRVCVCVDVRQQVALWNFTATNGMIRSNDSAFSARRLLRLVESV